MKSLKLILVVLVAIYSILQSTSGAAIENDKGETSVHFDFKTDHGYQRFEDTKFNKTLTSSDNYASDVTSEKPVEIRGGYSYISADGYEYTVKYKANKNGFQPYVTAHKLKETP